ncbi:mitochondrial import receptor subunit-like protein [Thermochaetoides thermophila DSM 1495]|uniref:Mitochondrial import receptor subunit-like protein n=1 Tax=Chaetomium thermophilum (strain DSM 1495 / CBS 144.50 / IMI 039719) TaxID=759272 RepID=G0SE88_CHATD|nr:mitochondrial import receptor subunit-like protein [Thermochaetoides thermophila DSM 1495]EGS18265.1 mitochondrial import receptor subunit-like protein [Thermochaetoides thermophila DSM 1495]
MAPAPPAGPLGSPSAPVSADSSLWDRISTWVSEHKAVVYTIAGVAVVITTAGAVYYIRSAPDEQETTPRPSKKERRKRKQAEKEAEAEKSAKAAEAAPSAKAASIEAANELPEIDENTVQTLTESQRKEYAQKLKEAGNKAYVAKEFHRAIELYTKAILCRPDPVYYSNRAACWNALSEWEKVVEDTTAAINLDPEYVKALNRRANAYDHLGQYSEALLDFTASCIIDGFRNEQAAQAVERLLKKFAETKAKEILKTKPAKLPSSTFVGNYLQSFRAKPRPEGLEDDAEIEEESGKGQLRRGLKALESKTGPGYEEAAEAFEKALELGDLGEYEALAYNMRGTFRNLMGKHEEALADLTKSIELDPSLTQSYIKRASMNLEQGSPEKAEEDFAAALAKNPQDPDIYYHRAQLHFIKGEFAEAQKDYQKSIDLDSDFIFSHIQLGVTQYKMGSIASSMATFRRCIKNFERTPDVYNYYGELLLDQGKFTEAIEKFEKAIELEKETKPTCMNVLPLINKSLAVFQWKQDFAEAEKLCEKALIIDPECDIAVATMAQLLLQQGKVTEALKYFERAAELARTEGELVNALSYAEATRTQIQVQEKYPKLASKLAAMGQVMR